MFEGTKKGFGNDIQIFLHAARVLGKGNEDAFREVADDSVHSPLFADGACHWKVEGKLLIS